MLEAGREAPRRAPRRPAFWWVIGAVYLVAFSVAATTAMVVFTALTIQADRLFAGVEESERSMAYIQADVAKVFEEFEQGEVDDERRAELIRRLRDIAEAGEVTLSLEGRRIAETEIWPINSRLERARAAYLRHNAAWVDYLARAAEDPAEFVRVQPEVNDSFFDARTPLWESIPRIDLLGLQERLLAIYEDSSGGGDGGGGTPA